MKIKFIIKKAHQGAHSWSYIGEFIEKDSYISNHFEDRTISTEVEEAQQFDTYDEALAAISEFEKIVIKEKKEKNQTLVNHVGAGIYQIEKIFVVPQKEV